VIVAVRFLLPSPEVSSPTTRCVLSVAPAASRLKLPSAVTPAVRGADAGIERLIIVVGWRGVRQAERLGCNVSDMGFAQADWFWRVAVRAAPGRRR